MSIVSKDIVFHVKFDLDDAKKKLDQQKQDTGTSGTRGVPAKQEAQVSRGGNRARQTVSENLLNKHAEKKKISEALKNQQPVSRHQPNPLGTGTLGTATQAAILNGRAKIKLGEKASEIERNSALKISSRLKKASIAKQVEKAEGLGITDFAVLGAKAVGGIAAIKVVADMAKNTANVGAFFEGALTNLANDSPENISAISRRGLGYAGAKVTEHAYRAWQWAKANVASYGSPFFLPERPVAAHGYNLAMAGQVRKNVAFTGFLGGENLGTLAYDLQQEQDLLDFSRDRGISMKASRAYGAKFTEHVTTNYKGIAGFLGQFILKGR